jgi:hypothetical protein
VSKKSKAARADLERRRANWEKYHAAKSPRIITPDPPATPRQPNPRERCRCGHTRRHTKEACQTCGKCRKFRRPPGGSVRALPTAFETDRSRH